MSREDRKSVATIYMDVLSGFLFQTNPKYLRPCRQCRGRRKRRSDEYDGRIVRNNPCLSVFRYRYCITRQGITGI